MGIRYNNRKNYSDLTLKKKPNLKLIIGIGIIAAALLYLVISSTISQARYFLTVEELLNDPTLAQKNVRMSGVVLGETITYDLQTLDLNFSVAQIPGDHKLIQQMGGMAKVLAEAANDPSLPTLQVHYKGARPDLLQDEAQAILTGSLDSNGVFQASELLLKCPSRYESELPNQAD